MRVWLFVLVLGVLPLSGLAQGADSVDLIVNVHFSVPLGCGNYGSGPHYSFRVYMDGAPRFESPTVDPIANRVDFGSIVHVAPFTEKTHVGLEVLDHFGGLFGNGESACNITGESTRLEIDYVAGQPGLVSGTGAGTRPASVEAYLSDSSREEPREPRVDLVSPPTSHEARLAWSALSVPGFRSASLRNVNTGASLTTLSTSQPGEFTWACLRPNATYRAQLWATGLGWSVASPVNTFTTPLGDACPAYADPDAAHPAAPAPTPSPTPVSGPTPVPSPTPTPVSVLPPAKKPPRVPVLRIEASPPGTVKVAWVELQPDLVVGFRLTLSDETGIPTRTWDADGAARDSLVEGLRPGATYRIRIVALGEDNLTSLPMEVPATAGSVSTASAEKVDAPGLGLLFAGAGILLVGAIAGGVAVWVFRRRR